MSTQLSAAEAAGAASPLTAKGAAMVVRSYASLAFAPPVALLQQLQALLLPQLQELEPGGLGLRVF